ncbi:hypothetical protein TNCV_4212431 [Trichonephila clavipes]|nr:hypothetical protein TNCV_4212431 [Trichonephila clavipes]
MHRWVKTVYGEYSLSHSSVVEWRKRFLEGRELLEDDARSRRAHQVITQEITAETNVCLGQPQSLLDL